jgi:hypothetical protein
LIVAAVILVLLFLAAIAGLTTYIFILRRRKAAPTPGPHTELQQMQAGGTGPEGMKAELPTNEGWAVELPTPVAGPGQEQRPWSNLNTQSPVSGQTDGRTTEWNPRMAELPTAWNPAPHKQYQELSG